MSAPAREVRKTVTILFCDLVQSTGLAEGIDPEAYRRVQSRYFEEMRGVVERHGGTVEKFVGDEVMAVFGVPTVHEDDALRAVRAARGMLDRLETLNEELQPRWGVRLQARIGVNTGQVVAGDAAGGASFVAGEPVIVAKRLEQAAGGGEILIGKETFPLVRHAVKAGPLERIAVKGKREDVGRRRVDEVDHAAPSLARRLDVSILGRQEELALLSRAFERVVEERRCRLFTVLGPAGIGKSRLAAELTASVGDRAIAAAGRCLPYGEGITFWPLTEILGTIGGEETLRRALGDAEDCGVVLDLLRGATGASEAGGSSEETFWAVRRALEAVARERPLIVCFEDLHWAEPTLLDLVEYLVGWSREAPILVLCLARPELVEQRPGLIAPQANADALALEPLARSEMDSLLVELAAEISLPAEARERIAAAAEGNPLFLEQMAAMAAERDGEVDLSIPPSIQALLAERLDRLSGEERDVIERAAVVGRDFPIGAVAALCPEEQRTSLSGNLLALVRKGLIHPDPAPSDGRDRFRFHHVLVRDSAYEAMPKELRAQLHEGVADWVGDSSGAQMLGELTGYHLEQAYLLHTQVGAEEAQVRHLAERGAELLASAGRRALGRGDAPAATGLLRRAAALSEALPDRRRPILSDLGAALRDMGELSASDDVLAEAIRLAQTAGDRGAEARAVVERAFTRRHRHSGLQEVSGVVERMLPVLIELGDDAGVAKALTLSGQSDYVRCRVGAGETLLERASQHAERAGDRQELRTILMLLARTNLDGPRPAEDALAHLDRLAGRLPGDPTLDAVMATARAPLEAMQAQIKVARDLYSRAHETLEELGRSLSLANARVDSGTVELLAGDARAAERELRWGFERLEAIGETALLSSVAALLGTAVLAQGRAEEAERYADLSEELSSDEDVFAQVEWRTLRASVCARTGRVEEAEAAGREAVVLMEGSDALNLRASAYAALAEAQAAAGRAADAEHSLAEAKRLFERKGNIASSSRLRAVAQSAPDSPSRSSAARSDRGSRAAGT